MRNIHVLLLLTATACAAAVRSFGGIPKGDLDALVGKDISEAVVQWGAPNRTIALADSTAVYTWETVIGSSGRYSADGDESVSGSSRSYHCVKSLVVSKQGKVLRWTANRDCPIY